MSFASNFMSNSRTRVIAETTLTGTPSLEGLFWIAPEKMGSINDVINSAAEATVWLGAQTRSQLFVAERNAVKAAVSTNGTLSEPEAYALDVGYMYGTILAGGDQPIVDLANQARLPQSFVDNLGNTSQLVPDGPYADYDFFQAVRKLELEQTGSDVIAFGLAAAQDHLGHVLAKRAGESPDPEKRTRLQNLAYVGVLSGALAVTSDEVPFPRTEIMRSARPNGEVVAIRAEFEPSDVIARSVHYEMTNERSFMPVGIGRKKYYAAVEGNYQFGPNTISVPLFTPDYYQLNYEDVIPEKRVAGVVAKSLLYTEDQEGTTRFQLIEGAGTLDDIERAGIDSITAVVLPEGYVSGIDANHPWTAEIEDMITRAMPGLSKDFCRLDMNDVADSTKEVIKRRQRLLLPALLLPSVFLKDLVGYTVIDDYSINWLEAAGATAAVGTVIGLAELLAATKRHHARELNIIDEHIQAVLDHSTLRR